MTLTSWEAKIHKTIVIGQWVALMVGVITDMVSTGGAANSWMAVILATAYALGTTVIPSSRYTARFGVESVTLAGTTIVAVVLTLSGGPDSPYLLLSMGPPVLATLYGGLRAGFMTGMLATTLLALITLSQTTPERDVLDIAPGAALYLAFVLLVGVIRRLFEDIHQQAVELAEEKQTATRQLERLEQINSALSRLSEDVSAGRLNAVEVSQDTLDTILERFPGSQGKMAVYNESGTVFLSVRGIPAEQGHEYKFRLSTADAEVGHLELITPRELTPAEMEDVGSIIYPVSIAFANLKLLEDIVGSAVSEERIRLAREMHDEIGPSLASLGLSLDMAAMQMDEHPHLVADLQVLRSNVTKLVEDVRNSVADLRTAPGPTLTARIMAQTAVFEGSPQIVLDIEERRPPRAAIIGDLTSIIIEATRNAHTHSSASKIVVSGQVDKLFGMVSVADDGVGFDPEHEPDGHYGLIGMRERANRIGAGIKFDSKAGVGTTVTVEWGNK